MVRLLSKIAIFFAVGALFYSQSAQADGTQVGWDFTVFAPTATTRTITATQISTGGTVISSVNVIGNGLYVGTVTGGTHANKAPNDTPVRFYEYADAMFWADPAMLSTGIGEPIMGVPAGSCPLTDTAYMVKFVGWDTQEAANHAMTDTNQPTGGLMSWIVSSNTARITTMYNNQDYGVPAWFPSSSYIDLDSGDCVAGKSIVTGTGDAGGTIFFTATGGFVYRTNGNKVLLGFPVAAIASKGALKSTMTGFLTWANNSQSHGDRIKPLHGHFDISGGTFIANFMKAPATNTPDQLGGNLKMTNIAINTPSNGFFTADLSLDSNSGKALCMVHDGEATTIVVCSAQRPGATSQPANLILFEQAQSSVTCDSETSATCTFDTTNHAIADGDVRYFSKSVVLDGTSGGGINAAGNTVSVEIAGNLTLQNGASMVAGTFNSISADTITVCSTCSISGNILALKAHDITVALGGSIDANAAGNSGGTNSTAGSGTGGGEWGANGGAGGSGGGVGGFAFFDSGSGSGGGQAPTAIGDLMTPIVGGGGGGGGNNIGANGGAGGGTLKLFVDGTLTVNGTILANGGDGANGTQSSGGGGGGGAIWLQVGTLAGSGAIRANGGNGGSIATRPKDGGGGAGGRISVNVTTNTFNGQYAVEGGTGSDRAGDGQNGTFYIDNPIICNTGTLSTTCTLTQETMLPDGYLINGSGNFVIASGGSIVQARSTDTINIELYGGDFTVQSGGGMGTNVNTFNVDNFNLNNGASWTGNITDSEIANRADIDATLTGNVETMQAVTIDISSTGSINADGRGELGGRYTEQDGSGSGGGFYGDDTPNRGGGGGSHAAASGAGVAQTGSTSGGGGSNSTTYGSISACNTKGSGGGAGYFADGQNASGGNGGGLVMLEASSLLNIEGDITARGLAGSNGAASSGGGGAGGSINLNSSGSITGSANVDASGGVGGGGTVAGGGGSGGYVKAVCSTHVTNTVTYTANGALGGGGASTSGGAGTADDSGCACTGICGGAKL